MRLVLGNRNAATAVSGEDGTKTMEPLASGKYATEVVFPDEWTLAQCFRALTDGDGIINNHFTEGAKPAWVASDNQALSDLVADNYDGIEVRDLEEPATDEKPSRSKK